MTYLYALSTCKVCRLNDDRELHSVLDVEKVIQALTNDKVWITYPTILLQLSEGILVVDQLCRPHLIVSPEIHLFCNIGGRQIGKIIAARDDAGDIILPGKP